MRGKLIALQVQPAACSSLHESRPASCLEAAPWLASGAGACATCLWQKLQLALLPLQPQHLLCSSVEAAPLALI